MATRLLSRVHPGNALWYALPLLLSLLVLFAIGFDQGRILSLVTGQPASQLTWLHEFYHDIRHAAGFPCH